MIFNTYEKISNVEQYNYFTYFMNIEEKQCINSNIGLINMQLLYTYTCKDKHRRGVLRKGGSRGCIAARIFRYPFFRTPLPYLPKNNGDYTYVIFIMISL